MTWEHPAEHRHRITSPTSGARKLWNLPYNSYRLITVNKNMSHPRICSERSRKSWGFWICCSCFFGWRKGDGFRLQRPSDCWFRPHFCYDSYTITYEFVKKWRMPEHVLNSSKTMKFGCIFRTTCPIIHVWYVKCNSCVCQNWSQTDKQINRY